MASVKSKKILLTGVSRGLGAALLEEFVAAGHSVAGCARDESSISDLRNRFPSPHHFSVVDLSDDDSVGGWIATVVSEFGVPDLVINNAATINENAPLWEVPYADFAQLMATNVNGVFSVVRHVVPSMLEKKSGVIANLSSGWGRSVAAEVASYCGSKWAIEGMTLALAQDLPAGMSAVPVNPGIINTDMLQSCFGASASQAPSPAQWAKKAAPFFLGLQAKHNGQSLSI
ncbi:MAG: SDR family oxidoreductase [Gammaproteobacteria bacterium]|nr:SDR family oxidoreductase [Gammaproteobacteria bacterium]